MNAIVPMNRQDKQPADQHIQPADLLNLCVMSSLDERTALAWRWNVV
jgi:hypothetical protein